MYFNSPPASRNRNAQPASGGRAAPASAPKSNGSAQRPPPSGGLSGAVAKLQEEEDDDDEEEEDDLMDQVAAYQQQLRTQGAPAVEEVDEDDGALQNEVSEYQLQLRNRDEADAVAGLATGNLSEIVSSRPAPKSVERSPAAVVNTGASMLSKTVSPESNRSALGGGSLLDDSMMGGGPDECTCTAGRNSLCPYCVAMNGPASVGR